MNAARIACCLLVLCAWPSGGAAVAGAPAGTPVSGNGRIEFAIVDRSTRQSIPCRIHLKNQAGKSVFAAALPRWRDHFVCPGKAELELPTGLYSYEIERGPEYLRSTGTCAVSGDGKKTVEVRLCRLTDLAAEGWWSGDLHVHRLVKDIELLMQAEDLHIAPVMTWWNNQNQWAKQPMPGRRLVQFDRNRFYHIMAGEDEREGGALLFFNLDEPLAITGSSREYPSPMKFVAEARRHTGVWIDIEKPFWWDVPVWLANGAADSIGLANNHMCRDQMYETEAWGKPRDSRNLPPPRGNGFWSQEIYYQILNCGLRLPPSAGSASGVLPNPVGYNRVYVHLGKNPSYEKWWEGLRAGRSFVSNGPLLRCQANGELPGYVFKESTGKELRLSVSVVLATQDPISSIEIVKNGRVDRAVPFVDGKKKYDLGRVRFNESGWFLVRVITDNPKTFRFASTAPYYVEIGTTERRISNASAQFFLDWTRERAQRVKLDDPAQRAEVIEFHERAEGFWRDLANRSNAE